MACGGLESPVWRDNTASVGTEAIVGFAELGSLGDAFRVPLVKESDFSKTETPLQTKIKTCYI